MRNGQMELKTEEDSDMEFFFPILGTETKLSQQSIAYGIYQTILEEEEISMEDFDNHGQGLVNKLHSIGRLEKGY